MKKKRYTIYDGIKVDIRPDGWNVKGFEGLKGKNIKRARRKSDRIMKNPAKAYGYGYVPKGYKSKRKKFYI